MPLGPLLVFGNQQAANPGASVLTLYCANPQAVSGNAGTLTITQPAVSTSTTGWTVGTTGAGNFSRQTYNQEVPATNFTATTQPSGTPVNLGEDCWRLGAVQSGQYSLGTWYSSLSVIAVTSGGVQNGRARFRLWRSHNADGTVATEIPTLPNPMVGTTVTALSTGVAQSSSASARVMAFPVVGEYLFLQVAWETT